MTDERLGQILRAAIPPLPEEHPPRDLWTPLVSRLDRGARWSFVDLGLAAAVVVTLLLFPEWLLVLVYHL